MTGNKKLFNLLGDDFRTWELFYRVHATRRMFERKFDAADLFSCLNDGIIIENYNEDIPFPSVLINGKSVSGRAMHAVVRMDIESKRLYIITVYDPDSSKWGDNYSRRITL